MTLKEWMYSMREQFGDYEFKVTYHNEKGKATLVSPKWRDDPPGLKEIKASDIVLPDFLREKSKQANAKNHKKLVKSITKYKETE
jgi:hypothetical protein